MAPVYGRRNTNYVDGRCKTRAHRIWWGMRMRCENPKREAYRNYGGRGITVCDRWLDFTNFFADMGEPPAGMTLEREKNDEGYSPDNCRWASRLEQGQNTRRNHMLTAHGVTLNVDGWSQRLGISRQALWKRLKKHPNTPLEDLLR